VFAAAPVGVVEPDLVVEALPVGAAPLVIVAQDTVVGRVVTPRAPQS
jgi:hypothetical protein